MDIENDRYKTIRIALFASIAGLVVMAIALVLVIVLPAQGPEMPFETAKRYASNLVNNGLYAQAVEQYEDMLMNYRLSDREVGSILYQIGDIYAEHLHNPREALAAYLKLQELYPDHPLIGDAERKIITQLDKIGQSRQAQRLLEKSVSLGKPASEVEPSKTVAIIGDRAISVEEIEDAIAQLPAEYQSQFNDNKAKTEFLKSYVGQQLIYDAALREGYDQKPEVLSQLEDAQRTVIVSAYYKDKVMGTIEISNSDIEMYYELHKAQYGGASLDEVRNLVADALMQEKSANAQRELIDELLKTEGVQLFPENFQAGKTE